MHKRRDDATMNNFYFVNKGKIDVLSLCIGTLAPVVTSAGKIIRSNPLVPAELLEKFILICPRKKQNNQVKRALFFSGRSLSLFYHLEDKTGEIYSCIDIKGVGSLDKERSYTEYFIADGRDLDETKDPFGGYLLSKAIKEYEFMEKGYETGAHVTLPLAVIRLEECAGPYNEELGLLIKAARSNIRLEYLLDKRNRLLPKVNKIKRDNSLIRQIVLLAGNSLRRLHEGGLSHNALHEENITLNGEFTDFEYSGPANKESMYNDLWYAYLALCESFEKYPLFPEIFVNQYLGCKTKFKLNRTGGISLEKSIQKLAESLINEKWN